MELKKRPKTAKFCLIWSHCWSHFFDLVVFTAKINLADNEDKNLTTALKRALWKKTKKRSDDFFSLEPLVEDFIQFFFFICGIASKKN